MTYDQFILKLNINLDKMYDIKVAYPHSEFTRQRQNISAIPYRNQMVGHSILFSYIFPLNCLLLGTVRRKFQTGKCLYSSKRVYDIPFIWMMVRSSQKQCTTYVRLQSPKKFGIVTGTRKNKLRNDECEKGWRLILFTLLHKKKGYQLNLSSVTTPPLKDLG